MKRLLILNYIYLIISLYGCSVDNATEQSYTTEQHDEATGLTLRPSDKMWVSFPEVVSIYVGTESCLGLTAQGPDVIFTSATEYFAPGYNAWGYYHAAGQLVLVNTNEQVGVGFPDRDKDIDTQVLKHEFVHHILYMNDIPYHDGESPELFDKCGLGVSIRN